MYLRMPIGKHHARTFTVQTSRKFVERAITGSIGIRRINKERCIVIAVRMFICNHPTVRRPRTVEIAQFLCFIESWPIAAATVSRAIPLRTITHCPVHGAGSNAARPSCIRLFWGNFVSGTNENLERVGDITPEERRSINGTVGGHVQRICVRIVQTPIHYYSEWANPIFGFIGADLRKSIVVTYQTIRIIVGIHEPRQANLLVVAHALDADGALLGAA